MTKAPSSLLKVITLGQNKNIVAEREGGDRAVQPFSSWKWNSVFRWDLQSWELLVDTPQHVDGHRGSDRSGARLQAGCGVTPPIPIPDPVREA